MNAKPFKTTYANGTNEFKTHRVDHNKMSGCSFMSKNIMFDWFY